MSLLFPLYLGGLLAVSLPIVFHMIRRTPSGRVPFSSLMFLEKSPPRLVKRKRLEHIALLCLRALVLGLLALAFARPYLRGAASIEAAAADAGKTALLIDTSASMRRPGLWEAALREARAARDEAPAAGGVAIFGFDDGLTEVAALDELTPTWLRTNLGGALVEVAERLQLGQTEAGLVSRIVLVSDLQQGSDLSELEGYDWPPDVELELRRVSGAPGNAGLHPGPRAREASQREVGQALRVRVSNAADSPHDRYTLHWENPASERVSEALTVFCPPGETRAVRAPERPPLDEVLGLVLAGDGASFDNVFYERPAPAQQGTVLSVGGTTEAEQDLDFFLGNVFGDDEDAFVARGAGPLPGLGAAALVVVNPVEVAAADVEPLREHVRGGGVVLVVLGSTFDPSAARAALASLFDAPDLEFSEPETGAGSGRGFALLSEVDFEHPLFTPFADPRYSDFTKVRFWRHRKVDEDGVPEGRVLARFDDGDPFLLERRLGSGRLLLATSGWEPADSDLARSSKFAPLLAGMARLGSVSDYAAELFHVGAAIPVSVPAGVAAHVGRPNGTRIELGPTDELFTETEMPGLYDLVVGDQLRPFTVYLDPEESRTEPLELDLLARIGVPLVQSVAKETPEVAADRERQELGFEIERRQKLWTWLIFAAVAGLLVETAWAGRLARKGDPEAS